MKNVGCVFFLGFLLAGCVQTQELPLAKNVVRLETQGNGIIGASSATNETLRRAAEVTLKNGYTHFVLADASRSQSERLVGFTPGYSHTNFTYGRGYGWANTTYTPGQPISALRTNVGVTVIMMDAKQADRDGGIDASKVLKDLDK